MARLVDKITNNDRVCKIYFEPHWKEYQLKLYVDGKYDPNWDYFTSSKDAAFETADAIAYWV